MSFTGTGRLQNNFKNSPVFSTEKTKMDKYGDFIIISPTFLILCGFYTLWYFRLREEDPGDC